MSPPDVTQYLNELLTLNELASPEGSKVAEEDATDHYATHALQYIADYCKNGNNTLSIFITITYQCILVSM